MKNITCIIISTFFNTRITKKTLFVSLFLLFNFFGLYAQNRVVLIEEFTNASCQACAVHNPPFDLLLSNNLDNVIPLKYRASIPGFDPMNIHNPSEVQTRADYYNIFGVPLALIDSEYTPASTFLNEGNPSNANQALLDAAAAVSAPFDLDVTHSFDTNYENISINVNIENVSGTVVNALQTGSMKLRVVIVEEEISFPIAPGTNGETNFGYTMRDMIPDANGTTLSDTWSVSETGTESFTVAIPSYIYSIGQLGVVVFIQDDATKVVHQAAYSKPADVINFPDAALQSNFGQSSYCNTSLAPSVNIINASIVAITSLELSARIEGGESFDYNWTGFLEPGNEINISIGNFDLQDEENQIIVEVNAVNGLSYDLDATNNFVAETIRILDETVMELPDTIGFEQELTPPNILPDIGLFYGGDIKLLGLASSPNSNVGAFGNSKVSLRFRLGRTLPGEEMNFITPIIDFSDLDMVKMKFSHAYVQMTDENDDRLDVAYSTDCGVSWNNIFSKSGSDLATAPNTDIYFPEANEWVENIVEIPGITGAPEVIFWFKGTSNGSHSLYLDDITFEGTEFISDTDDIDEIISDFSVSPNPLGDVTNINFYLKNAKDVQLKVTDLLGRTLYTQNYKRQPAGSNTFEYHTADLKSGIYFITIDINGEMKTVKVVK